MENQREFYHEFELTNNTGRNYKIGVELVPREKSFDYRAYDLSSGEPHEISGLRNCPLTNEGNPSIVGIERHVTCLLNKVPVKKISEEPYRRLKNIRIRCRIRNASSL